MLSEGKAENGKLVDVDMLRGWKDRLGLARREEMEEMLFKS